MSPSLASTPRSQRPWSRPDGGWRLEATLPLPRMIRVLIADDRAVVRAGLRMILEAQDGNAAVEAVAQTEPNVVLMDVRMPELDGIEATRRIGGGPLATRPRAGDLRRRRRSRS